MKTTILLALALTSSAALAKGMYKYSAQDDACVYSKGKKLGIFARNGKDSNAVDFDTYELGYNEGSSGECRDLRDASVSSLVLRGNNRGINISGNSDQWSSDLKKKSQKKIGGLKAVAGSDLTGIDLSNTNGIEDENLTPRSVKLSGVKMRGAKANKAVLYRSNLSGSDLSGLEAWDSVFVRANLEEAQVDGANFYRANLQNVNLKNTKGAPSFRRADLSNADLRGSILHNGHNKNKFTGEHKYKMGADFSGAVLKNADLRGADLTGSNLKLAQDLKGAKFDITKGDLLPFSIEYALKRGMVPYINDYKLSEREAYSYAVYNDGRVNYLYPATRLEEGEDVFGLKSGQVDDSRKITKQERKEFIRNSSGRIKYDRNSGEYRLLNGGIFSISDQ